MLGTFRLYFYTESLVLAMCDSEFDAIILILLIYSPAIMLHADADATVASRGGGESLCALGTVK